MLCTSLPGFPPRGPITSYCAVMGAFTPGFKFVLKQFTSLLLKQSLCVLAAEASRILVACDAQDLAIGSRIGSARARCDLVVGIPLLAGS